MSITRWIHRCVPNLVPIGSVVRQLSDSWMCDPLTSPPPPDMPPGVLRGDLYLAYAHSQMNPQTWTKVGANRSSRLTASPDSWMFDPLNPPPPPSAPLCLSGQFVWRISIPRWICTCVPNLMPIGPAVWHLPPTFEFVTPNPPMSWGELYLAYVHSQTNPQTCTKFGANRSSRLTAYQDFWICDPLNPPEKRATFGVNRSSGSALSHRARCLAQKHAKKQHLYIENYNSGPNMQTTTSLPFFTAIFVALGGALAEKLMICCRHVRTELYIDYTLLIVYRLSSCKLMHILHVNSHSF